MEKQRDGRKFRFIFGLLTVCIAGFACALPAKLWAESGGLPLLQTLCVECLSDSRYADTDCMFRLTVPAAVAEEVSAEMPELPAAVDFKSLRRFKYAENGGGTAIEVGLCFRAPGKYTVPPLTVTADGQSYAVPFQTVEIERLPVAGKPRLSVQFDGEVASFAAGEPAFFTLFVEAAEKVTDLTWNVPQNALFEEVERYPNADGAGRTAGGRFAVARFEWTPYHAGRQNLPEIRAEVYGIGNAAETVALERTAVTVQPAAQKKESAADRRYFARAFDAEPEEAPAGESPALSAAECAELAALRSDERHSGYLGAAFYKRKQFEGAHGIRDGKAEPRKITVIAAAFIALASACAAALLFFLKKARAAALAACCALTFMGLLCLSAVRFGENYGIFRGGAVSAVPETSATPTAYFAAGARVKIKRKSGSWYNIRSGSAEGWVMQDAVEEIR